MAGDDLQDERLVSLSKDGNLDAFNSLVSRYETAVFNLCYRLLGDRGAAEDAAQEAFIAAYRAIDRFEGGNVRSWLLRIAANRSKDELRRRRRRGRPEPLEGWDGESPRDLPDPGRGAAELLEAAEVGRAIQAGLLTLPFDQRQAVVLVDYFQLDYFEAAHATGSSLGTLKSRLHRGRERLRGFVLAHPELFGDRWRSRG